MQAIVLLLTNRFGPYFIEPVIAGLENGKPFICAMDLLGAACFAKDFVLSGTGHSPIPASLEGCSPSLCASPLPPSSLAAHRVSGPPQLWY